MNRYTLVLYGVAACACAAVGCSTALTSPAASASTTTASRASEPERTPAPAVDTLSFSQLFAAETDVSTHGLRVSDLAQSFSGRRVRMVGFMAELEMPPHGAFYLTPRPVHCDEAGAGTGDLPVETVLVNAPFLHGAEVPHVDGAIEVIGTLETGNAVDAAGFASTFRIRLDPDESTQTHASRQ